MPLQIDPTPVREARAALADQTQALVNAIAAEDEARTAWQNAVRTQTDVDDKAAAHAASLLALKEARRLEEEARGALWGAIWDWQSISIEPQVFATPEQDIGRLEQATGIVLFPVRLETRFDQTAKKLRIRVYPDEISLDTHEPALTPEEEEAAFSFYEGVERFEPDDAQKEKWRALVSRFGAERSAYILRRLRPYLEGETATQGKCDLDWLEVGLPAAPDFPTEYPKRPSVWTRPGQAVLPDRWVVACYRNGGVSIHLGSPIPEPLTLTPDPGIPRDPPASPPASPPPDSDVGGEEVKTADGFIIQKNLLWTIDYDEAERLGMAVTINLSTDEAAGGFDKVIVLGVKSSMLPTDAAGYLEKLFDAHHYTRGLAVVPQGTPTNNTEGSPSAFPPVDTFGEKTYASERGEPPFGRESSFHCPTGHIVEKQSVEELPTDIDQLARLLGVPNGVFANVLGAREGNALAYEQGRAWLMNDALWPVTWGYFLEQMMSPVLGIDFKIEQKIQKARRFFRENVRARGPAPAFRIGSVPYGVLPIVSLASLEPESYEPILNDPNPLGFETELIGLLRNLRTIWLKSALDKAPRIRRLDPNQNAGASSYDDLISVLAQGASAQQIRVRGARSRSLIQAYNHLLGNPSEGLTLFYEDAARTTARSFDRPSWNTARVFGLELDKDSDIFADPLVTGPGLPTPSQYISAILLAAQEITKFPSLRNDKIIDDLTGVNNSTKPLLYRLLRHAVLVEYGTGMRHFEMLPWREIEFTGISPQIEDKRYYHELLFGTGGTPAWGGVQARAERNGFLPALRALGFALNGVPTEEVERLLAETLDLSSHRLDAWITAFATKRLLAARENEDKTKTPFRSYFGGYAWVHDVRPNMRSASLPGGYIHAPSLTHAATAAVLRHAHVSRKGEAAGKYTVDLSSDRVSKARKLLDELRDGHSLGASLGYRFERGLRAAGTGMEPYIMALRKLYPLVADKGKTEDTPQPADKIAARNVVDGWLLYEARAAIPFGTGGLPGPGTAGRTAILAQIAEITVLLDAVGDLTTSESVHQLVRGNVDGASATLEALAHGYRPPDPEVARSPRTGTGATHRIGFAFTGEIPDAAGWTAEAGPRAAESPNLDRYVGTLLGDPSRIGSTVFWTDAAGNQATATVYLGPNSSDVGSKALDIRPLDLVALAVGPTQAGDRSILDRRILAAALEGVSGGWSDARVQYEGDPTFPHILEVARALGTALAISRPLDPHDLLPPAEAAAQEGPPSDDAVALRDRAEAALGDLRTVASGLEPRLTVAEAMSPSDPDYPATISALRETLREIAAYVPWSFPEPDATQLDKAGPRLTTLGRGVMGELERRIADAETLLAEAPGNSVGLRRSCLSIYRVIFGNEFIPSAPFVPSNASEVAASLADRATLLPDAEDQHAPSRMLAQAARVREPLARWRKAVLYAGALEAEPPNLEIVQVPFLTETDYEQGWIGRRGTTNKPFPRGRISCLLAVPPRIGLVPDNGLEGLLLDEWTEVIPSKEEETGIAVHYNNPGAEAPQAVLVAASPLINGTWTFKHLLEAVDETFDLLRLRAAEPEHLPTGQALPAAYVSLNLRGNVPTTRFDNLWKDPRKE